MKKSLILLLLLTVLTSACNAEPGVTEVTRLVEIPVTEVVERVVVEQVEVTREVDVIREITIEVTRLVEIPVTVVAEAPATLEPTQVPEGEVDTSQIFSFNFGGEAESNGVTVEFARAIFMQRDAIPDQNFDDNPSFNEHEYVGEAIWRITNNTDSVIFWFNTDTFVRVNGRQEPVLDWYRVAGFGESPSEQIFPGSTIVGGMWFGLGNLEPNDVESASLLFGTAYEDGTNEVLTDVFVVDVDLSGPHLWVPFPDELR